MAAVAVTIINTNEGEWSRGISDTTSNRGPEEDVCRRTSTLREKLDPDGNGRVSLAEMVKALDEFDVNVDVLTQRLKLDVDMRDLVRKLPIFGLTMTFFLWSLSILSPAENIAAIHRHLETHFKIDDENLKVRTWKDIYTFLGEFDLANEELQATSPLYWCEEEYFKYVWDRSNLIPRKFCPSKRLKALHHHVDDPCDAPGFEHLSDVPCSGSASSISTTTASSSAASAASASSSTALPTASPSNAASTASSSAASTSSSTASSFGGSRRLKTRRLAVTCAGCESAAHGSSRRLGGGGGQGSDEIQCYDNDCELKLEEGDCSLTCENQKDHVCSTDLGILLCPVTCGFCPPFQYERIHKFDKPQVTMLPTVIHQTRFAAVPCHGFAETYNHQPPNPDMVLLPALDGKRNGEILTCVDRTKYSTESHAVDAACPEDGKESIFCENGHFKNTKKRSYHNVPIYPKMLYERAKLLTELKELEWLDVQTSEVEITTLVYTEGIEVFTSVSVKFTIDEAGNIDASKTLISYRDLINQTGTNFILFVVLTMVISAIGCCQTAYTLCLNPHCDNKIQMFELFTKFALLVYAIQLLITWNLQLPMSMEYDHLLHTVLDFHGEHTGAAFDTILDSYYKVKEHIYEESLWLARERMAAYGVCYLQFWQLLMLFSLHPRMGSITATCEKAMSAFAHFTLVFIAIYSFLAFMAFWMIGTHVEHYGSFGDTLATQMSMFYGEFVNPNDSEASLHPISLAMYWVYKITFALVVFLLLMNFFLAIVVEAFLEVRKDELLNVTEKDILSDSLDAIGSLILFLSKGWPTPKRILSDLQVRHKDGARSMEEVLAAKEEELKNLTRSNLSGAQEKPRDLRKMCPLEFMNMYPDHIATKERVAELVLYYYNKCDAILSMKPRLREGEILEDIKEKKNPEQTYRSSQQSFGDNDSKCGLNRVVERLTNQNSHLLKERSAMLNQNSHLLKMLDDLRSSNEDLQNRLQKLEVVELQEATEAALVRLNEPPSPTVLLGDTEFDTEIREI